MATPPRVLVCGSRAWSDRAAVARMIDQLPVRSVVIVGGAKGADTLAEVAARAVGPQCEVYPADWGR